MFLLITLLAFGASFFVQAWLKKTYATWSTVSNAAGINGFTAARHILDSNGLSNVTVEMVKGALTDHYIPSQKLLRLSEPIYTQPSVASIAVAAHEVGHAIQDSSGYFALKLKAIMMPLAAISSKLGLLLVIGGGFLGLGLLSQIGMLMFIGSMGMQLLTLPIEFDASRRALEQLKALGLVDQKDEAGARSVLRAAAMTYVASAATSAALIAVTALQFFMRRRV